MLVLIYNGIDSRFLALPLPRASAPSPASSRSRFLALPLPCAPASLRSRFYVLPILCPLLLCIPASLYSSFFTLSFFALPHLYALTSLCIHFHCAPISVLPFLYAPAPLPFHFLQKYLINNTIANCRCKMQSSASDLTHTIFKKPSASRCRVTYLYLFFWFVGVRNSSFPYFQVYQLTTIRFFVF